jgi:hypothetical protein
MTFIHSISSAVVEIWVLLNFILCTTVKNSLFDWSILNFLQTCQGMCFMKVLWGVSIYLYRFWCLSCKQPLPRSLCLTPLHTRQELVSLTDPFWTSSKSYQGVWKSFIRRFDLSLDAQSVDNSKQVLLKNSFQLVLYAFQKFYIISNHQYVIHIYY